jgi:hypothetical protein
MVKVMTMDAITDAQIKRLGFMLREIAMPVDFDRMGAAEIDELFGSDCGAVAHACIEVPESTLDALPLLDATAASNRR